MKVLKDILYKVNLKEIIGLTDIMVSNVQFDSRNVGRGDVFVAVKGFTSDGHDYIDQTIDQGAIAIVVEKLPENIRAGVNYIVVENSGEALGIIASNFYDNPSEKLTLVGVTGTNGKSTTVTLLYRLFTKLGYKTGLLSTINNVIGNNVIIAQLAGSKISEMIPEASMEYYKYQVESEISGYMQSDLQNYVLASDEFENNFILTYANIFYSN